VIAALAWAALLVLLPASPLHAQAATDVHRHEHKPTLRAVMQELGAEYVRLGNALMVEDFKVLEESAKAVESHPLPAELVAAIKSKLGRSFRAFERTDDRSHHAAADLARRAAASDVTGAARAFAAMTQACVSCHKQFRATLRSLSD
jgi:cytochrome c556